MAGREQRFKDLLSNLELAEQAVNDFRGYVAVLVCGDDNVDRVVGIFDTKAQAKRWIEDNPVNIPGQPQPPCRHKHSEHYNPYKKWAVYQLNLQSVQ